MSKWYEVKMNVSKVFAVEIEDGESSFAAKSYALDESGVGVAEIASCVELKSKSEISSTKRHADEVLGL